jgi:tight adherence protein B
MPPVLILGLAGVALLLVVGGIIATVRAGQSSEVDERLSQIAGDTTKVVAPRTPKERTSVFADRLEETVAGRGFAENIKAQLQQADLKLRVSEYLVLYLLSVVGFGAISWLLFGKSIPFTLFAGFMAPRIYVKQAAKKRLKDYNNQLGDTLNLWVNALRSGYSVLQAMETIASETPPPVSVEFERVVQEVRLGMTLEQAMDNLMTRIPSDDMDLVVTAVNVQREVGGNLAEILAIISHTIRERVRIRGEIATLTAQVTMSGYVISGLPVALTLFLRVSNPGYINELFYREPPWVIPGVLPCGWLVLALGLALIFSGFVAMRKLADIEI